MATPSLKWDASDVALKVTTASGGVVTMSFPDRASDVAFNMPLTALTNPMTTAGDVIVANTGGTAKRLGVGSEGQVLKVVSGEPAWYDASKDFCHAYIGTAYSTPGGVEWVKIPFDTSLVDTNNIFDETLDRVVPKKPGIYLVIARMTLLSGTVMALSAFKNGTNTVNLSSYSPSAALSQSIGTGMLYVNGTTDYIEIYIYSSAVVSSAIDSSGTFFQIIGPL